MPPVSSPGSFATDSKDPFERAAKVRFRRALVLLGMTLLIPGSAQLVAGSKKTGRLAMRVWLALIVFVLMFLLIGLVFHGFVWWFFTNNLVLGSIRFGLMALAVGWAVLLIDAWRLGNPPQLMRQQRLAMTGLNGVLVFGVAGALLFASHIVAVQKDLLSTMFGGKAVTAAVDGRYNILLLGGDSGAGRWGLRPDSINVASIDARTGETILFGLPRNMTNFKFAKGSVMAEQFPKGYDCGPECELNSLATWAADHKNLFKGVAHPGVQATTDAVEGITGLKINYYAMVNMRGFKKLVDAVGGVKLRVREPIPIGGGNDVITKYVKPGNRTLSGYEALWFARSRKSGDDYSRMARQKCVMSAMVHQLDPKRVVLSFEDIAAASAELISTDLPRSELDTFAQLALKARSHPIRSVSFVPPAIHTSRPDLAKIRRMVDAAIDPPKKKSTQKGSQKSSQKTAQNGKDRKSATGTTGGSLGNMKDGYVANESADLQSAC